MKIDRLRFVLCVGALLCSVPASAQDKIENPKAAPVVLEFKNRPSLQIGKVFRLEVKAKVQTDFRTFSPEIETDEGTFDFHRARLGIEGDFLKVFEYEVERDFRQNIGSNDQRYPWKDVFINFRHFDNFQLKLGKFKVPFGLDELTGEHQNDFTLRSRIADDLSPGRDVGGSLHGRFFKRGLSYEAGIFRHDGENGRANNGEPPSGSTFATRVTATPLRELPVPLLLRPLEIGVAYTRTVVPEGLSGVRGHTSSNEVYFQYFYVKGPRERVGLEANLMKGRFSLKSELISMREARLRQGIYEEDLPLKVSKGWYVTGTWVLTGEKKEGGVEPRKAFPSAGVGAIELAGRFEQIRFGSRTHPGEAFSSPRSPNIRAQSDRVWTAGVNWYANRYVKVQINGVHENIEDRFRSPLTGRSQFWMGILRLQFAM